MNALDKFLRNNALKQTDFAKLTGYSRTYVSNMVHGEKPISEEVIKCILENTYGWDTSAFLDESIKVVNKGKDNDVKITYKSNVGAPIEEDAITPAKPEASASVEPAAPDYTVPIIPLNALAGTLNDYTEGIMPYQCEKILNPFASQATIAIKVNGESMMPKYPSGTLVFCRKVNEKAFIEYFHTYVLDTANGVVIKQIEPTDSEDTIKCVSLNTKYPPFELEKQYIYGWWKVVGCVMFE